MVAMITIVSCNKEEDCTCGEVLRTYHSEYSQPIMDIENVCTGEVADSVANYIASVQEGDTQCGLQVW